MNCVHPVGVHVIGEPTGTTDSRNENHVFTRNTQFRHQFLDPCEDRIISASRAPTDRLIRNKIRFFISAGGDFVEGKIVAVWFIVVLLIGCLEENVI